MQVFVEAKNAQTLNLYIYALCTGTRNKTVSSPRTNDRRKKGSILSSPRMCNYSYSIPLFLSSWSFLFGLPLTLADANDENERIIEKEKEKKEKFKSWHTRLHKLSVPKRAKHPYHFQSPALKSDVCKV